MKKWVIASLVTANLFLIPGVVHAQWIPNGSNIYFNSGVANVGLSEFKDTSYKLTLSGGSETLAGNAKASHLRIVHNPSSKGEERFWTFRTLQWGRTTDYGSYALEISQPANDYLGCTGCGGDLVLAPWENTIFKSANSAAKTRVGINTINPKYELSVNGTILAKEIKVSTSATEWPDYVFDKEYKLKDLNEVESFIEKNKHLPGVPSNMEMEKDGISLGEVSKIQMEKIEELTLYIIQLEKRINQLEFKLAL